jgi:hypothetical protein
LTGRASIGYKTKVPRALLWDPHLANALHWKKLINE